jgi:hypothetical protein
MTTPRKRPETVKPARAREARPKPPRTGSGVKPPAGMVTVTRTVGAAVESYTGTVADLRRLGVVPAAKRAK